MESLHPMEQFTGEEKVLFPGNHPPFLALVRAMGTAHLVPSWGEEAFVGKPRNDNNSQIIIIV